MSIALPILADARARLERVVRSYFAGGVQGGVWHFFDTRTLGQDTAGATPVTASGQAIKYARDLSGNGNHMSDATGSQWVTDSAGKGAAVFNWPTGSFQLSVPSSTNKFNFLHDGTGGTLIAILEKGFTSGQMNLLQNAGNQFNQGILISVTALGAFATTIYRGVNGTTALTDTTIAAPCKTDTQRFIAMTFKDEANPQNWYGDNIAVPFRTVAALNNPVATGAASLNLTIPTTCTARLTALFLIGTKLTTNQIADICAAYAASAMETVPAYDTPIIIAGQSNAAGGGVLDASYERKSLAVAMLSHDNILRCASEPSGNVFNWPQSESPTGFTTNGNSAGSGVSATLAVSLGKELIANTSRKPVIVPCAMASSSLAQWAKGATGLEPLTLFGEMMLRIARVPASNVPIIFWMQGEQDAGIITENLATGTMNTTYIVGAKARFDEIRTMYPNSPIIFGQSSINANATTTANQRRLANQQRWLETSFGGAYANANTFMVVTHDLSRDASANDIHISEAGAKVLATRIRLSIQEHVLGMAVDGTGPRLVRITKVSSTLMRVTCSQAIVADGSNYGGLFTGYDAGVLQTISSAVQTSGDDHSIDLTFSAPTAGAVAIVYGNLVGVGTTATRSGVVANAAGLPLPMFGPEMAV